jgi:hypothetical protein
MVSLINNANSEGIRFYTNPSEPFSQYNYLYDPEQYPSNLTQMDYQWNLFYPQNCYAMKTKRKKKFKEQQANEKISKENLLCDEPSREEIIQWL